MMGRWVGLMLLTMLVNTGADRDHDPDNREIYGTPGETLDFGSVYEAGPRGARETHSVTVRLEAGSTRRLFQFITSVSRMFVTSSYAGRVGFDPGSGSLKLLNFTQRDAGTYLVTLTDRGGTEWSRRTLVKVYEPVLGAVIHANVTPATISLLCEVAGGTGPEFHWIGVGVGVRDGAEEAMTMVSEGGRRLTLTLGDPATCGVYTCRVKNRLNAESANFSIRESDGFPFCRELQQQGSRNFYTSVIVMSIILILVLIGGLILLVDGRLKRKMPTPPGWPQVL